MEQARIDLLLMNRSAIFRVARFHAIERIKVRDRPRLPWQSGTEGRVRGVILGFAAEKDGPGLPNPILSREAKHLSKGRGHSGLSGVYRFTISSSGSRIFGVSGVSPGLFRHRL